MQGFIDFLTNWGLFMGVAVPVSGVLFAVLKTMSKRTKTVVDDEVVDFIEDAEDEFRNPTHTHTHSHVFI